MSKKEAFYGRKCLKSLLKWWFRANFVNKIKTILIIFKSEPDRLKVWKMRLIFAEEYLASCVAREVWWRNAKKFIQIVNTCGGSYYGVANDVAGEKGKVLLRLKGGSNI